MKVIELAEYINVSNQTIYKWVREKTIPHQKLGKKMIRFDKAQIDRWLEKGNFNTEEEKKNGKTIIRRKKSA